MNSNKFINGTEARKIWSKSINVINPITINNFNNLIGNKFIKKANILLDHSNNRITTLTVQPIDKKEWSSKQEHIYIITRNDIIMKIGGTRDGMYGRWGSYLCGHYVPQRNNKSGQPYPGKMSVTNAHLYHTIENDIINNNSNWEFYTWTLPKTIITIDILGEDTTINTQTFHAYESICIKKFKEFTGCIPILCENSDPSYK